MPYSWTESAEQEGAVYAEKLPNGTHRVTLSRIVFGNRNGSFQSRSGDPQIMLVFTDNEAREASQMVTLSEKAAWVLARMMGCFDPPANLERMESDGIEPMHFADQVFAEKQLLHRQLDIEVAWEKDGDREFVNVTPIKSAPISESHRQAPQPAPTPPTIDAPPAISTPPVGMTKDQAWAAVVQAWADQKGSDTDRKRNEGWVSAVRSFGKPEAELAPADWAHVAESASLPF